MKPTVLVILCAAFALSGCTSAEPEPADEAVVMAPDEPIAGKSIGAWTEEWWRWTFGVPAAQNPELVLDQDCGIGQDGSVFFVPAYDGAKTYRRTCVIPKGKPVLVPLWVIINDHPCPDPTFEPAAGQSLEDFLRQGAIDYNDMVTGLEVTLDGASVDVHAHRHTTGLFEFQAEQSLVGALPDPCLNGMSQSGVGDGYWLALTLSEGPHEVRVTGVDPSKEAFDHTYVLSTAP
ncbi:hypothetical protein [Polyangium sp. y55x31]|uniref:hypothetical protein n=1 Tax=Polyangium sp. y55x31 TaxID=3042688 RepID=UPI002482A51D|nr:hypothetical protein [Polyangium sp. y55x31]MDI1481833.1 hypothetical protein [Polyangium sp. y55x31]